MSNIPCTVTVVYSGKIVGEISDTIQYHTIFIKPLLKRLFSEQYSIDNKLTIIYIYGIDMYI